MPAGRTWTIACAGGCRWQIMTARESEVYYRRLAADGRVLSSWRPGLPALQDASVLPESLREVLDLFVAAARRRHEEC